MFLRLPIAFVVGAVLYMVGAVMTVYDGFPSMVFQPIVAVIVTAFGAVFCPVIGFVGDRRWL